MEDQTGKDWAGDADADGKEGLETKRDGVMSTGSRHR